MYLYVRSVKHVVARFTVYQPKFDHLRYEVTSNQLAFSALSKLTRELVASSFSTPKITQTRRPARRCGTQVSYFKPLSKEHTNIDAKVDAKVHFDTLKQIPKISHEVNKDYDT